MRLADEIDVCCDLYYYNTKREGCMLSTDVDNRDQPRLVYQLLPTPAPHFVTFIRLWPHTLPS